MSSVRLPQRSRLSVVPLPVVVGTDVSVVLVADTGLAQVPGVVPSGVVLRVLNARHTAVAKEVADGCGKRQRGSERNNGRREEGSKKKLIIKPVLYLDASN